MLGAALVAASIGPAVAARYADDLFATSVLSTKPGASLHVPLYDGRRPLGDVRLTRSESGSLQVSRRAVIDLLGHVLPDATLAALDALGTELVSLDRLAAIRVPLRYDEESMALYTELSADQRRAESISIAGPRRSLETVPAASVSALLNMAVETAHFWERDETAIRFSAESMVNIEQFVLENEFDIDNDVQTNGCSTLLPCATDYYSGVKRRGTRLVRDLPDERLRVSVGDIRSPAALIGRSRDFAGVYVEHSHRKLAPDERVTGVGSSSFRLERPSRVEVSINGAMMQALDLPPGNYDLDDLPLQTGANRITVKIVDNQGITRTIDLDRFSGDDLLVAGKSEWTVGAGVPSYFDAGSLAYQEGDVFASAFGRYGLLPELTLEGEAQTDGSTVLASAGALTATPWGLWGLVLSASMHDGDIAPAARATWRYAFNGSESVYASAEVHASDFRLPGQFYEPLTDTFVPAYPHKSTLSAGYAAQLPWDTFLNITGRYDVADPNFVDQVYYAPRGDRYALDLSLSRRVLEEASLTATVGYSNQTLGRRWLDANVDPYSVDTEAELWVGLRFSWRPSASTFVSASTETLNRRTFVQGTQTVQDGTSTWSTSVTASDDQFGVTSIAPSIAYRGQRAEFQVTHDTGFESFLFATASSVRAENRTYARFGTALAFADGHLAVSAPMRSNGGFAILYPHESLGDMDILAGNKEHPIGHSDWLGPVVVRDISSHTDTMITYDVPELPMEMSLGTGSFGVHPWYRSGYAVEVGGNEAVTLIGRLLKSDGAPLDYASGVATDGNRTVPIFTSKTGKFAADQLAPGRWVLSTADESGDLSYVVDIPQGATGNLRVGDLRP